MNGCNDAKLTPTICITMLRTNERFSPLLPLFNHAATVLPSRFCVKDRSYFPFPMIFFRALHLITVGKVPAVLEKGHPGLELIIDNEGNKISVFIENKRKGRSGVILSCHPRRGE